MLLCVYLYCLCYRLITKITLYHWDCLYFFYLTGKLDCSLTRQAITISEISEWRVLFLSIIHANKINDVCCGYTQSYSLKKCAVKFMLNTVPKMLFCHQFPWEKNKLEMFLFVCCLCFFLVFLCPVACLIIILMLSATLHVNFNEINVFTLIAVCCMFSVHWECQTVSYVWNNDDSLSVLLLFMSISSFKLF